MRALGRWTSYAVAVLAVVEVACRMLLSLPIIAAATNGTDFGWRRAWVQARQLGTPTGYGFDVYDPTKGWWSKANLRNLRVFRTKVLNTNARGIRGTTDYAFAKPDGVFRVVLLGDSYTFGEQVSDGETYGRYLERLLPGAEVINMGVHGYGHDQMLILLEEEGVRYRPDVVILGFTATDIGRNVLRFRDYAKPRFVLDGGRLALVGSPVPRPDEVLRWYALGPRVLDVASAVAQQFDGVTERRDREAEALTAAIVARIIDVTRSIGAVAMLVYLPARGELVAADTATYGERVFTGICAANHCECGTLRPDFQRVARTASRSQYADGHYSPFGNRTIAKALRRRIERLPQRSRH